MPRRPKLNLATVPQHVIQRGNNRQATCFAEAGDLFHRECLGHSAMKYGCRIYAQ
jgi:putative transposase